MSLRLEMLQVARVAPKLLEEAGDRVVTYLGGQINSDGGGRDRAGKSDLYYTVFVLEGLIALQQDLPVDRVRPYLESFGDGEGLDLVHLACLARCWAAMDGEGPSHLADRLESHRTEGGGYGSLYHDFLVFGALQDLGRGKGDVEPLVRSVMALAQADGSFANQADIPAGTTPTTAAAVTLLRNLGTEVPSKSGQWLLGRVHPKGGFVAAPGAPMPDLLSTATALHALSGMKTDISPFKEAALDFVDTLWTGKAFCGSWADDTVDAEYTYYAMLSLGHLALA